MGKSRWVGNAVYLTLDQTSLLCDFYKDPVKTSSELKPEQKRHILNLLVQATNLSSIGGRVEFMDGRKIDFPHFWIEEKSSTELIQLIAQQIGIIDGTLSVWEHRGWLTKALASLNLSKLTNLNLGTCRNEDFRELTGKTPELKRFRMRLVYCIDKGLFINFIKQCPKLEVVCLNTHTYKDKLLNLVLENAPSLKILKISGMYLSEEEYQALKARVANGSIHTLDFKKIELPRQECWAELIEAGKDTLQAIVLDTVNLHYEASDDSKKGIMDAIAQCKKLKRLHLNSGGLHEFTTDDFFLRLFKNNPELEEVRSYWLSKVTDATLETIQTFGKNLKVVYLHQTEMTRPLVEAFNDEFWKSEKAELISISGSKVDDWQDPNSCVKGGNHFRWERKGRRIQNELLDSHRRYWDPAFDPALKL